MAIYIFMDTIYKQTELSEPIPIKTLYNDFCCSTEYFNLPKKTRRQYKYFMFIDDLHKSHSKSILKRDKYYNGIKLTTDHLIGYSRIFFP